MQDACTSKDLHIPFTIGKEDWCKYGDMIFSRINKFRLEFGQALLSKV
jgi:hypothetical protein